MREIRLLCVAFLESEQQRIFPIDHNMHDHVIG